MSIAVDSFYLKWRSEFQFQDKEISRYKCKECKHILLKPYQTDCGLRLCLFCIEKLRSERKTCPGCYEENFFLNIVQDKATEKEISKLRIKCINSNCTDILLLKNLKAHLEICEYRKEKCVKCSEVHFAKEKKEHLDSKCEYQLIKCSNCNIHLIRREMEMKHKNINSEDLSNLCDNWQRECPNKCTDVKFDNIKYHLEICSRRSVKCVLSLIGCEKIVEVQSMSNHIKDDEMLHLKLFTKYLFEFRSENCEMKSQILESNMFVSDINQLTLSLKNLYQKVSISNLNFIEKNKVVHQLSEKIKTTLISQHFKLNINLIGQSLTGGNGDFIWTVNDIHQRINAAKENLITEIVSDAFYTNIPGYRMKLKIYPNGDGIAKDKYLSFFFIIFKGNYDEVILWPFSKKIVLSVLSEDTSESFQIIMRSNNNLNCYGKPTSDHNIGAGQPNFISINDILSSTKYVTNGALKIKFCVISK